MFGIEGVGGCGAFVAQTKTNELSWDKWAILGQMGTVAVSSPMERASAGKPGCQNPSRTMGVDLEVDSVHPVFRWLQPLPFPHNLVRDLELASPSAWKPLLNPQPLYKLHEIKTVVLSC